MAVNKNPILNIASGNALRYEIYTINDIHKTANPDIYFVYILCNNINPIMESVIPEQYTKNIAL